MGRGGALPAGLDHSGMFACRNVGGVEGEEVISGPIPDDLKDKIEVSTKTPVDLMDELGERGVSRVYVDGGAVIRSFLRAGLISDMKLSIVPILIGDGLRIFEDFGQDIDLKLQETSAHPSGLVDLVYSVT